MEGSGGKDQPGMFVSFEKLLGDLSTKLDEVQRAILGEITSMRQEIATKASKEHVDAVAAALRADTAAVAATVAEQGRQIVDLRVGEGASKGVSTTILIGAAVTIGGIFAILGALIYVVAQGHGG